MHAILTIVAVVVMVALAIAILGLRDWLAWRRRIRRYLNTQAGRENLTNDEFCRQVAIDPSTATIVGIVRMNLAEFAPCDASRIYPGDTLHDFALDYDDDVAMLVQKMGIISGFSDYSFPMEEVGDVGGFTRLLLKMKEEAEPGH